MILALPLCNVFGISHKDAISDTLKRPQDENNDLRATPSCSIVNIAVEYVALPPSCSNQSNYGCGKNVKNC